MGEKPYALEGYGHPTRYISRFHWAPACHVLDPDLSFDIFRLHEPANRSPSAHQSTMLCSNDLWGVMGFPGPFVPFPALGGPFSWLLVIGIFLGCTLTSTLNNHRLKAGGFA
jgi:hypothetical protein